MRSTEGNAARARLRGEARAGAERRVSLTASRGRERPAAAVVCLTHPRDSGMRAGGRVRRRPCAVVMLGTSPRRRRCCGGGAPGREGSGARSCFPDGRLLVRVGRRRSRRAEAPSTRPCRQPSRPASRARRGRRREDAATVDRDDAAIGAGRDPTRPHVPARLREEGHLARERSCRRPHGRQCPGEELRAVRVVPPRGVQPTLAVAGELRRLIPGHRGRERLRRSPRPRGRAQAGGDRPDGTRLEPMPHPGHRSPARPVHGDRHVAGGSEEDLGHVLRGAEGPARRAVGRP